MLTVAEFRRLEKIEQLRSIWKRLWESMRHPSLFQSFDWCLNNLRKLDGDVEPRVLLVSMDGRDLGLLPMVAQSYHTQFGTARLLRLMPCETGAIMEPIGPNTALTWHGVAKHLKHYGRQWDGLEIDANSNAGRKRIQNAFNYCGMNLRLDYHSSSPIVDLSGGWFRYWNNRSAELQTQFLAAEKRLSNFGPLRFDRYRPQGIDAGSPRWELFGTFLRAAYLRARDGRRLIADDEKQLFNRIFELGHWHRAIDLSMLYVNNRPSAALFAMRRGDCLDVLRVGRDIATTRDGVDVLTSYFLKDSASLGDRLVRFPGDDADRFYDWTTRFDNVTQSTYFVPLRPKAQILRFAHWRHRRNTMAEAAEERFAREERRRPITTDNPLAVVG